MQREHLLISYFKLSEEYLGNINSYYYIVDQNYSTVITKDKLYQCKTSDGINNINLKDYTWNGTYYLHVVAGSQHGISTTSHYIIKYNQIPLPPTLPFMVNGK